MQQILYIGRDEDFGQNGFIWFDQNGKKLRKRRKKGLKRPERGQYEYSESGLEEKSRSKKQTEINRKNFDRRDFIEVYVNVSTNYIEHSIKY